MSEKKAATEFTVKRSEWNRGGIKPYAKLLNSDGKCCLGFYCLASGFTEADILDTGLPSNVRDAIDVLPKLVKKYKEATCNCCVDSIVNTKECRDIAGTNDNSSILDSDREAKLKDQFAAIGVTVNFVD